MQHDLGSEESSKRTARRFSATRLPHLILPLDQNREQLDPDRSVVDTVADGNDTVTVAGVSRHVHGYLEDFLFPPERARSPVRSLSGGERNRLLLARLLTQPANVLVLDEPTNDLDLETLELLEAELVRFPGTILVVSHDRRFLNNVVTSTLVFEGDGRVEEYLGGYDDWQRQRPTAPPSAPAVSRPPETAAANTPARPAARTKLSYREKEEFETLPAQIAELESEEQQLQVRIAGPDFYKESPVAIEAALARLEAVRQEIHDRYQRWDALDSRVR